VGVVGACGDDEGDAMKAPPAGRRIGWGSFRLLLHRLLLRNNSSLRFVDQP